MSKNAVSVVESRLGLGENMESANCQAWHGHIHLSLFATYTSFYGY